MASDSNHYVITKPYKDDDLSGVSTAALSNDNEDDDALSVASTTSKFKLNKTYRKKTWRKIVKMGAVASVPTIGMAILAIVNPILFLAGAGIASLLSVGVGGAYYCLWNIPDEETDQNKTANSDKCPTQSEVVDDTLSLTELMVMSEEPVVPTALAIEADTQDADADDDDDADSDSNLGDRVEKEEQDQPYDIPSALSVPILNGCEFYGLDAKQFFEIFFGDSAPFSFQDFQEESGDINIKYHPWQTQPRVRLIEFETPTNSAFCKPYSRGTKQQDLLHCSRKCVVMESTTTMQDVPFSDCFNVQEQWVISCSDDNILQLMVTARLNFTKSCAFEHQIRSKTVSTLQENLGAWSDVAKRAVRISQRQRQKEEQARQQKLLGATECIEVRFSNCNNGAFVIGEEEEEEDWEMDPLQSPKQPTKTQRRRRRRNSLGKIRNTFSKTLKAVKAL